MLLPCIVFCVLLIWSLKDGDLYPKEGLAYGAIFLVLMLGMVFLQPWALRCMAGMALLDVVLILKVFGQDVKIW
jgi:hypothetical protein